MTQIVPLDPPLPSDAGPPGQALPDQEPAARVWNVPDHPDLSDLPGLPSMLLRSVRKPSMALMRGWWRLHVHGRDHVPTTGPVILASNHIAVIDGPLIVASSPRHTYALAKNELFTGVVGRLLRAGGQVPVQRGITDTFAVRRCLQVLQHGHALGVFPEGIRGLGDFERIHSGAVYLAMVTGAPIVPLAMLGTRLPGHSTRQLPPRGSHMHVVFGEPIRIGRRGWPRRRDDVVGETVTVREQLAAHVAAAERMTGVPLPGAPRGWPGPTTVGG